MHLDEIILDYIRTYIVEHVTRITNNIIEKLNIDSICSNGKCYYKRCVHKQCILEYCIYNIITGDRKCTIDNIRNKINDIFMDKANLIYNDKTDANEIPRD